MAHRAAIYIRISKEDTDQARRGLGLKRQEKDCRTLAERKDWPVADVFIDDDISAYIPGKRPEYARLLEAIKSGDIDGVIVYDLDRLHRHPLELEEFFRICDNAGLTDFASVSGDFDLANNDGRMMARVMGAVAKKSSDDSSRRLRRKHEEIAQSGRPSGGPRPFGYATDHVTVIETEAEMIRDAAQRILAGETMGSICRQWNEAGTFGASGSEWRVSTLRQLMLRARLSGQREYRGEIIGEATWPAILDRTTWQNVRARLTDPGRQQNRPWRGSLLTGLARCGRCQSKLVVTSVNGKAHYRCFKAPGIDGCGALSITAAPTEDFVIESAFEFVDTPALATATRRRTSDTEQQHADNEVDAMTAKLGELSEMWASNEITRSEWLTARKGVETRLIAAQRAVTRQHRSSVMVGLDGAGVLRGAWPELVPDRRRAVLGELIDRITIVPARVGLNKFDVSRIDITWK